MNSLIKKMKSHINNEFFILFLNNHRGKFFGFITIRSNMVDFEEAFLKHLKATGYVNCFYFSYKGILLPLVPRVDKDNPWDKINLYVPRNGYNINQSRFEVFFNTNNLDVLNKKERFFYLKNISLFHNDADVSYPNLVLVDFFDLKF